jgi:hypothetical protein
MHSILQSWRGRTLVFFVAALLLGHAAAAWGLARGMPEAPYGDEARFFSLLVSEMLRLVWAPWQPLTTDADAPAGFARLVLPLTIAWLAGEGALHFVRNPLRLFRTVRRGGHDVFAGVSPLGLRILGRWAAAGRAVVAVSPNASDCEAAVRSGAAALESQWGSPEIFKRSGLTRAGTLVVAAGRDLENMDTAAAAAEFIGRERPADMAPVHILLQVNDPFLRARIDERIDRFGRLDAVQLRLVSANQIAARRLMREHPLDRYTLAPAPRPHAWVVGLGQMGEEIALSVLRLAHFRHGGKAMLTLVDREAESRRLSLTSRWPGAGRVGELRYVGAEVEGGAALIERLTTGEFRDTPPTAIYLCLGGAEANVALAMSLGTALRERGIATPPVCIRGRGSSGLTMVESEWVHGFGDIDWIADGVLTVETGLDQLARHVHERYLAEGMARGETMGARRALRPWILLPEDLKDDNRNVADHHFGKIRDCGCRVVKAADAPASFQFEREEIESLAEVEHRRWLAIRELNGWRHGAKRDDAAKVHPDMVSYAELPEDRRDLDRAVVRSLPEVLREIGLGIARDFPVAVTGPRTQWAFVPGFEGAVAAELEVLKTASPSARPVLWITPESAMACRVAEIALERGFAGVSVMLSEPPHSLLDRLPDDLTKARVRRLLRVADRIVQATGGDAARTALRERCRLDVALSVDGSDIAQSARTLGMDASGRVLWRPAAG